MVLLPSLLIHKEASAVKEILPNLDLAVNGHSLVQDTPIKSVKKVEAKILIDTMKGSAMRKAIKNKRDIYISSRGHNYRKRKEERGWIEILLM
ncbi:unnamed protein product [Gordionus sp. m RMFG-2023]